MGQRLDKLTCETCVLFVLTYVLGHLPCCCLHWKYARRTCPCSGELPFAQANIQHFPTCCLLLEVRLHSPPRYYRTLQHTLCQRRLPQYLAASHIKRRRISPVYATSKCYPKREGMPTALAHTRCNVCQRLSQNVPTTCLSRRFGRLSLIMRKRFAETDRSLP